MAAQLEPAQGHNFLVWTLVTVREPVPPQQPYTLQLDWDHSPPSFIMASVRSLHTVITVPICVAQQCHPRPPAGEDGQHDVVGEPLIVLFRRTQAGSPSYLRCLLLPGAMPRLLVFRAFWAG